VIRKENLLSRALPAMLLALLVMVSMLVATASADHNLRAHISQGTINGNGAFDAFHVGTTPAGTRAYFETQEKLVSTDTDSSYDVYERFGNTTTLISTGPSGGNGALDAFLDGISADGSRVFFTTREVLTADDSDTNDDVYERFNKTTTTRISTGPSGGNGAVDAFFAGASQDGTKVFFETDEGMEAADTDGQQDIYQRQSVTTTKISTGPNGGNGAFFAGVLGVSQDGNRVFFETDEKLVTATDSDAEFDIYERTNASTTSHISTGPNGGNGPFPASYGGISQDGTKVIFETEEVLVSATDSDSQFDVYQRSGSTTTQVSVGSINGNGAFDAFLPIAGQRFISDDASHVFFETDEQLTSTAPTADTDAQTDVYDRSGGTTTKISAGTGGNGAFDAFFLGASSSGTVAFFETQEVMAAGDTDAQFDTYSRSGSTTTRQTTGTSGGNGAFNSTYVFSSTDGSRVFFETDESLETADTDTRTDVYERFSNTGTTRISTGSQNGNGLFTAFFTGASDDGTRAFFDTQETLKATDTDTAIDVYAAVVSPAFPRPASGTPLRVPLVQAYKACTSPNSTHVGPKLSPGPGAGDPACDPPVKESSLLTVGTAGAGSGFAKFRVLVGPSAPPDDSDISIQVSATDVREQAGGADYTGQVIFASQMSITDNSNGFDGQESGTVQNNTFAFPITCIATGSGTVGGNCSTTTTVDTLVPGFAKENSRMVIRSLANNLLDLGADGVLTPGSGTCPPTCGSGDEKVFETQGMFTP
jgi:hypothetical protein